MLPSDVSSLSIVSFCEKNVFLLQQDVPELVEVLEALSLQLARLPGPTYENVELSNTESIP